jgi:protein farnesyltransferase/geranylgeranyltransferase type-1 subunit alpha
MRDGEQDRERVLKRELRQVDLSLLVVSTVLTLLDLNRYVKQSISLAPNNASAWNYLRGVLNHNKVAFSSIAEFVKLYTVPYDGSRKDIVDVDLPPPGPSADLPCAAAIEFLADVYEQQGDKDGVQRATEVG